MAKFSLRRFEDQARASVLLGIVACVNLVAQVIMVFRHIDTSAWVIMYGNTTRKYLVLLTTAACLLMGAAAVGLGYNSAGQRRNEKGQLSWLGFFMGAGVVCLAVICYFVFHTRSEFIGGPR